jgi:hypothetical protein
MHGRDPGLVTRLVKEGIVAQSTIRCAAGAGVVAASLLIMGPNPAQAVADKHGSGSHYQFNGQKNRENRQGNGQEGGGANWVNDVFDIEGSDDSDGSDNDQTPSFDPPLMDLSTGGSDLEDLAVVQSIAPDGPVALRSAAIADVPTGVNASGAAAAPPRAGSDFSAPPRAGSDFSAPPRAGSDFSAPSGTAFRAPRVVIGNGRTPGVHDAAGDGAARESLRDSSLQAPEPEAVPAVPAAVEINIPPLPLPVPPVERIRSANLVVGELGKGAIDTTTDPLAGLAGLILIPAVGAVLGYRQARAAQSLRESTRRESART